MTEKETKINTLPGHSGNNIVYLVLTEDITVKTKFRAFITLKVNESPSRVQFIGCELKWSDRDKIKDYNDAIKLANLDDTFDITYPWPRIISIRNLTYKRKDINNTGEK